MTIYKFENLELREDGTIIEWTMGGRHNPVMEIPDVSIVGRSGMKRTSETHFEFKFQLTSHTMPEWRDSFQKRCSNNAVDFIGDELVITCAPSELERIYREIVTALPAANAEFRAQCDELVQRLRTRDEQRRNAGSPRPTEGGDRAFREPRAFSSDAEAAEALAILGSCLSAPSTVS